MRRALFAAAALLLLSFLPVARAGPARGGAAGQPCALRKIYVADFGPDPRHVNFRLGLKRWLAKKRFTVVERPEEADAVLSGEFTTRTGGKYSYLAFKDAELKTAGGEAVWRGDFDRRTKNAFGWLGRGHIENGARHVAEDIRASCK